MAAAAAPPRIVAPVDPSSTLIRLIRIMRFIRIIRIMWFIQVMWFSQVIMRFIQLLFGYMVYSSYAVYSSSYAVYSSYYSAYSACSVYLDYLDD